MHEVAFDGSAGLYCRSVRQAGASDPIHIQRRGLMFLRKLWSSKLGEWLFGSGVAIACIAPIGANASVSGGFLACTGAGMSQCLDNNTGGPCTGLSGDGSKPLMYESCTAYFDGEHINGHV